MWEEDEEWGRERCKVVGCSMKNKMKHGGEGEGSGPVEEEGERDGCRLVEKDEERKVMTNR